MIFVALAADYDDTLARDGRVDATTIEALRRLKSAGKRLIMVTGRHLEDLQRAFDALDLFDAAVVENGAVVFLPATGRTLQIGEAPPPVLTQALRERGVEFSIGRGIIATSKAHQSSVREVIQEQGLDWRIVFNKGAAMLLPAGVDKGAGLAAALAELGLSPVNVVGIGDAENDEAFLSLCGCSVAVANALPAVKSAVDLVTRAGHGVGVRELIDGWIKDGDGYFGDLDRRRHDADRAN